MGRKMTAFSTEPQVTFTIISSTENGDQEIDLKLLQSFKYTERKKYIFEQTDDGYYIKSSGFGLGSFEARGIVYDADEYFLRSLEILIKNSEDQGKLMRGIISIGENRMLFKFYPRSFSYSKIVDEVMLIYYRIEGVGSSGYMANLIELGEKVSKKIKGFMPSEKIVL